MLFSRPNPFNCLFLSASCLKAHTHVCVQYLPKWFLCGFHRRICHHPCKLVQAVICNSPQIFALLLDQLLFSLTLILKSHQHPWKRWYQPMCFSSLIPLKKIYLSVDLRFCWSTNVYPLTYSPLSWAISRNQSVTIVMMVVLPNSCNNITRRETIDCDWWSSETWMSLKELTFLVNFTNVSVCFLLLSQCLFVCFLVMSSTLLYILLIKNINVLLTEVDQTRDHMDQTTRDCCLLPKYSGSAAKIEPRIFSLTTRRFCS